MSCSPYVGKFDDLTGPFLYARGDAVRGYPVLAQSDAARLIATELVRTLVRFESEAVAYCILPERAHVLAAGLAAGADPHAGIRRWKHVTGLNWYARCGQRLWRERSVVCDLADVTALDAAAAYLIAAPVRAGLVPRADQYRWVSATRWSVAELARRRPTRAPPWWRERVTSGARSGYSLPR